MKQIVLSNSKLLSSLLNIPIKIYALDLIALLIYNDKIGSEHAILTFHYADVVYPTQNDPIRPSLIKVTNQTIFNESIVSLCFFWSGSNIWAVVAILFLRFKWLLIFFVVSFKYLLLWFVRVEAEFSSALIVRLLCLFGENIVIFFEDGFYFFRWWTLNFVISLFRLVVNFLSRGWLSVIVCFKFLPRLTILMSLFDLAMKIILKRTRRIPDQSIKRGW